ncbi:MAG: division/cell wall cluster transcriptional repressor MraZ [Deferribacterota bacterium]|nr:division/cell wall cluster transcriptional repressor MraZ [Deferribacterota bacterium]
MNNLYTSFKGKSIHSINESGRVSIPSKFRDILKSKYGDERMVLVTVGTHIVSYPVAEWIKLEQMWDNNPPRDQKVKKFLRYLYSTAEEVTVDKQGRILIPQILRESVKLTDECVITGQRNKIEIWPITKWKEEFEGINVDELYESVSDEFPELSI